MSGVRTTGAGSSMASDEGVKEGESAFVEIGMSILTTRKSAMCDSGGSGGDGQKMMMAASEHTQRPRSLQECEIFEPINDKVCYILSLCIFPSISLFKCVCMCVDRVCS